MSAGLAPPPRVQLPRVLQLAGKVFTRGPAFARREIRKRALRLDYLRGQARRSSEPVHEEADPAIVEYGKATRAQLIDTHLNRHIRAGYRVLMYRPESITAEIWFGDLQRCMQHTGIDCRVLPPSASAADINREFEAFQPNVFISTEAPRSLRGLDLEFIRDYKRRRGCLRLFIPVWHARSPRAHVPPGRSTATLDAWRRGLLRSGLSADAHFSIFEPEFHALFSRDTQGPVVEYVAIPQGCNPFTDYPEAARKLHDYFMAASMTDERVEVSYRTLRPILRGYHGLWAGARWGFGAEQGIPPAQMPLHYAQTRIALSPLVGFVHRYAAEITHRVFAAAACGAFQITMPTAVTHRFFRSDELVQAASPAEYVRLFEHYVHRPLERNAIAFAALRRVYGEHTCFHRIDKLAGHWDDWRRRGFF